MSETMNGTASEHTADFHANWTAGMVKMKLKAPDIGRAFGGMFQVLMMDGALASRDKELIAVGIAVATRCEACILSHVEKSLKLGATPEQIMEAGGVGVVMQGGPAYVHMPDVMNAIEFFQAKAAKAG